MKFLSPILLLLSFIPYSHQECNYIALVKCFTEILDEWTFTLYELRDNVVTINNEQCSDIEKLDLCTQDAGNNRHECNHSEIIAASNTVTDLFTHRKNSGSFLKSYYLLKYACSTEGQNILNEHRECLKQQRIGEMTITAGTYLSEKFLDHPKEQACAELNGRLNGFLSVMDDLCDKHSARKIMCRSLVSMFQGMEADKLHDCHFNCTTQEEDAGTTEEEGEEAKAIEEAEKDQSAVPESHSLNSATALRYIASAATIALALFFSF